MVSCTQMTWCCPVVMCRDRKTMAGRFVEACRRRDLKMNAEKSKVMMFTGEALSGVRKIDRVSNTRIRELCEMTKGMNERIDEDIFR